MLFIFGDGNAGNPASVKSVAESGRILRADIKEIGYHAVTAFASLALRTVSR